MTATLTEILEALTPILERLAALEHRVAAIEKRGSLEYLGVWQSGRKYARGAAVTDHGSLWVCEAPESDRRPGDFTWRQRMAARSQGRQWGGAAAPSNAT